MATVYITQELLSRVKNIVITMRNKEISAECPDVDKYVTTDCGRMLTHIQWFGHHELFNQIPKEWLSTDASPTLKVTYPHGEAEVKASIQFTQQKDFYFRPSRDRWGNAPSECTLAWLHEHIDQYAGVQEIIDRVNDMKRRYEITEKWDKVMQGVTTFLQKCKSLNEAVKLLPNIKMYIHPDDIERLERKVIRTKREDVISLEVVEDITAAAVAARLAGAV